MMIVLIYTGANEVAGDRTPQCASRGTYIFMLNVLFVNFYVNIKILMRRDIFFRYNYEIVVYIHMLIRYCLFYFYFIIYG